MSLTPNTPPYEFQQYHVREDRLPSIKRMFNTIDQQHQTMVNRSTAAAPKVPALFASQPLSPPDLLHDLEEDDEHSLSTPSVLSSPKQSLFPINDHDLICNKNRSAAAAAAAADIGFVGQPIILPPPYNINRRKSVPPRRSPSITGDVHQISAYDRSVVFQLNTHSHCIDFLSNNNNKTLIKNKYYASLSTNQSAFCSNCSGDTCDFQYTSKVICGQSLLSALREKVAHACPLNRQTIMAASRHSNNKFTRTASIIEIPRQHHYEQQQQQQQQRRRESNSSSSESTIGRNTNQGITIVVPQSHQRPWVEEPYTQQKRQEQDEDYIDQEEHQVKRAKKSASNKPSHRRQSSSGRPSRLKGPCQACHEASDGCMRKAFNWPFPASQVFKDKGKPFVYLCNKCGLRYNKSGGAVCRNCRWVICKEEKRKALQHIDAMRRKRPDGHVDLDEDIKHFICSPKYWTCGQTWKVGWVLNQIDGEQDDDHIVSSPGSSSSH